MVSTAIVLGVPAIVLAIALEATDAEGILIAVGFLIGGVATIYGPVAAVFILYPMTEWLGSFRAFGWIALIGGAHEAEAEAAMLDAIAGCGEAAASLW